MVGALVVGAREGGSEGTTDGEAETDGDVEMEGPLEVEGLVVG